MKHLPIIWLLILLSIATACTKYEEGPAISLRKAKNKIAGNWRITSYTVDGADSMQIIRGLHLQGDLRFVPFENYSAPPLRAFIKEDTTTYSFNGVWGVDDKGRKVYLYFNDLYVNDLVRYYDTSQMPLAPLDWEITRLKHRNEMWLEIDQNGKLYELQFKAI